MAATASSPKTRRPRRQRAPSVEEKPMRHAFEAALEDAERDEPARDDPPSAAPSLSFAGLVSTLETAPAASHSLWEFAAAWTPEADPPPPSPAPPRPSARPQDIAEEIELPALRTPADIARARRRFMWENHPDRRGDIDRDLANQRVATANMLFDRALAALTGRRFR
jgi:hypothetical protein